MTQNEPETPGNGPDDRNDTSRYSQQAQAAADRAKAAAQDALGVSRRLVANPVAGIGEAHASLGQDRVLGVSIVFALVAAIGLALAGGLMVRVIVGTMAGGYPGTGFGFDFGDFLQAIVLNLVAIIAAGGGVLLLAPMFGGRASAPSALFTAATAFLPLGIAALLAALVGGMLANRLGTIIAGLLMLYGACYLVLVLNAGLRQVAGIDERRAALATPSVLAFAALVSALIGWLFD